MKKLLSLLLLICFVGIDTPVFALANMKLYAEKVDDYRFKTVLKHYTPYYLTIINRNNDIIYLSSETTVKYEDKNGVIHSAVEDEILYKTSRKKDVAKFIGISLPITAVSGFVTVASFLLLAIPALGLSYAGTLPYQRAVKYNSNFAQDYYINNSLPLNLKSKELYNFYVFLPKDANAKNIVIKNLSTDKVKSFDIKVPVLQ